MADGDLAACLAGDLEACARLGGEGADTGSAVGQRFQGGDDDVYTLVDQADSSILARSVTPDRALRLTQQGYRRVGVNWVKKGGLKFVGTRGQQIPYAPGEYTDTLGRTISLGSAGKVLGSRVLPQGRGGVEGSGRTAAEEALTQAQTGDIAARRQLEREQMAAEAAYRQQQLELERQRAAEEKRQNLLAAALRLTESQMTAKSAAQTQGVTLAGTDPFRFIGQLRGQDVAAGVQTPYDIFKGYLQGQATAPLPNVGPNSTTQDLESALGKLHQMQQQTQAPAPTFGFAGGGMAPTMGPYQARLVGEQGSQIAPGTEVMITGNNETMILPLQAGMQEGGFLKPGSLGVFPQLFANLRSDLTMGSQNRAQNRARLGYLPEGSTAIGPLGGGYGGLTTPLSQNLRRGYQELVGLGKISQADADFAVNAIGELPNPRNAKMWFSTLTPVEREAVLSLYKLAAVPAEEFDAMVKSAMISGPARQPVSLAA